MATYHILPDSSPVQVRYVRYTVGPDGRLVLCADDREDIRVPDRYAQRPEPAPVRRAIFLRREP